MSSRNARLRRLRTEFDEVLNDAAGVHVYATLGLQLVNSNVLSKILDRATDLNAQMHIGHGPPGDAANVSYQRWTIGSLAGRLAPDGMIATHLGQQWLVSVYSQWEDHYRGAIAEAMGYKSKSELKVPIMGDLGKMRNDIIHHRGVAQAEKSGRCEVLRWFEGGDVLFIDDHKILEFMRLWGRTYRLL